MSAPFKFCANCNTRHSRLARKCSYCGGKAIWVQPTREQIEARQAEIDRREALLQRFISTGEI